MNNRGFQLIELTIACLLVISTFTSGVANWQSLGDHYRLHRACEYLTASLMAARSEAVVKNVPVQLCLRPDGRAFGFSLPGTASIRWRVLPRGVRFDPVSPVAPTFYSRGNIVPGASFFVSNPAGSIRVVLSPAGRIRWERTD